MLLPRQMLLLLLLVLLLMAIALTTKVASESQVQEVKPNCTQYCGSVHIPYPFGTTADCSLDDSFLITCDQSSSTPTPMLQADKLAVFDISPDGELRIANNISQDCYDEQGNPNSTYSRLNLSHFSISPGRNKFVALGCDTYAAMFGWDISSDNLNFYSRIASFCISLDQVANESCNGFGCNQNIIPKGGLRGFVLNTGSMKNHTDVRSFNPCGYAFIAEDKAYNFSSTDLLDFNKQTITIVLDWAVGNQTCQEAKGYACKAEHSECFDAENGIGYRCRCSSGFQGNPYLLDGCHDIDECKDNNNPCPGKCRNKLGSYTCKHKVNVTVILMIAFGVTICLLILLVGSINVCWELKKRKLIALRKQAFRKNGGILLEEQIAKDKDLVETAKIFTEKELRKATNNFDESMVLGQGGTGTVYRGVLSDNTVVAIKKSKIIDQKPVEQLINEVIVLSQINHRNVVKLLGCCLETDVPLLVYEFVTNGTLSDHLHNESQSCQLSWTTRLRVATETAGALAYLHSATFTPIIHRDVKTTNILLDDNLTAKISDFGASKLVPLNKTQITTLVQGTLGYLDPEYFQTCKLTEKSDVYSFGVVLTELLTSKTALCLERPENERNLATHFVSSIRDGCLLQVVDNYVVNHANIEQLKAVAYLAEECLRAKREERPTMKEVAMELEILSTMDIDDRESVASAE